ncbi:unnamed protein product [Cuscuta epithymum]|uniref:Translation initiation factor IF-3 n=1 Tax=Cuscuta epithymum TaxID=186058 RepID=A0AAV0CAV2_9ASTE|nr:unnamed protein product [Cuscuta epithymum]
MAGLASTLTFNSIISKPKPIFLPYLQSTHLTIRLPSPTFSLSSSPFTTTAISAQYSGRRAGSSNDDDALDISSIRSKDVRLIDQQQNMVGIVSKSEAIQRAEDSELDLVIISPEADPPVVKIMDYNKYKYELQKKKKDQQKKNAANRMDLKELKMGYSIDVHDYSVRLRAAQRFLRDGNKVKVIVNLKGRENEFKSKATELLKQFQNDVGELATLENKNFRDRNMFIILAPNKAFVQKAHEQPKEKDKSVSEAQAGG